MIPRKFIQTKAPLSYGAMAAYPYSSDLEKRYFIKSKYDVLYSLSVKRGNQLMLPRGVCPIGKNDIRTRGLDVDFDNCSFEPRTENQVKYVNETIEYLRDGHSGISRAPTGMGKTACCMPIIAYIGKYTVVCVQKQDLVDRWYEDFRKILGLKPNEIGHIQGDRFDVQNRKVAIAMVQSLSQPDRYPAWVAQIPGLMIFDEVHRLGAPEFMKVCYWSPALLRMGTSATTKRPDGMEIVFNAHIGPERVHISEMQLVPKVLVVETESTPIRNRNGKIVSFHPGRDAPLRKRIYGDHARNVQALKLTASAYAKGRQTVVFCDYLDHIDYLRHAISKFGVPFDQTGVYVGGMSKAARAEASQKKVIFATLAMMSEGTDIPSLDTGILLAPRGNIEQIVGRILRTHPTKAPPVFIDFLDKNIPIFKGYFFGRTKFYAKIGAEIVNVTVD